MIFEIHTDNSIFSYYQFTSVDAAGKVCEVDELEVDGVPLSVKQIEIDMPPVQQNDSLTRNVLITNLPASFCNVSCVTNHHSCSLF